MQRPKRGLSLFARVALMTWAVVLIAISLVALFTTTSAAHNIKAKLGEQILNIGRTIAQIPSVQANLGQPCGEKVIQPLVEQIRKSIGSDIIVVVDMNGTRYSHPNPELVGGHIVGGDEQRALAGEEYLSEAVGTLGPQLRGFVPIYSNGHQSGAVMVSMLIPKVSHEVNHLLMQIYAAMVLALIFGLLAALWLGTNIKKMLFGMEPQELAVAFQERDAILESIREGIIAIDAQGRVSLINDEAKHLLDVSDDVAGQPIEQVVPNTRLPEILMTGERQVDQEQLLGDTVIWTNRVPMVQQNRIIGAVASFRDKTELRKLAEELTGVRKFVEALRVQNHEFLNKLHTISGLIQLGETDEALDFISHVAETRQALHGFLSTRIHSPSVLGLLLGKAGRAQELGVELSVRSDSFLPIDSGCIDPDLVVVTVGNLIENALEAVTLKEKGRPRLVEVGILQKDGELKVEVVDNGPGIAPELRSKVFEQGFSTKGSNRGLGLAIITERIHQHGGSIEVGTSELGGARFAVSLPCRKGEDHATDSDTSLDC